MSELLRSVNAPPVPCPRDADPYVARRRRHLRSIVEPVVAVLADMGYLPAPSALSATAGLVDGSAADRFIDQAARSLADDALGLHVAQRIPLVRVTRHYGTGLACGPRTAAVQLQ